MKNLGHPELPEGLDYGLLENIIEKVDKKPWEINPIYKEYGGTPEFKSFVYYGLGSEPGLGKIEEKDISISNGIEFVKKLYDALKKEKFAFKNYQNNLEDKYFGEKEPEDFANILLYASTLLPRNPSNHIFEQTKKLEKDHGEIFDPQYTVKNCSAEYLHKILKKYYPSANNPNLLGKMWLENSKHLIEEFDGSILNYINSVGDKEKIDKKLQKLVGVGQKTSNYFINKIVKRGCDGIDENKCDIAMDVHKLKIPMQTKMVDIGNYVIREKGIDFSMIQNAYKKVGEELDIGILRIDELVWMHGNQTCSRNYCGRQCAIDNLCKTSLWSRGWSNFGTWLGHIDYLSRRRKPEQKALV